jgi:hypothetical protein
MTQPLETARMLCNALGVGDAPSAPGLMHPDIKWIDMGGWPDQPDGRGPQLVAENVLNAPIERLEGFRRTSWVQIRRQQYRDRTSASGMPGSERHEPRNI